MKCLKMIPSFVSSIMISVSSVMLNDFLKSFGIQILPSLSMCRIIANFIVISPFALQTISQYSVLQVKYITMVLSKLREVRCRIKKEELLQLFLI